MDIIVTGVGGFIGPHVARRFSAEGHSVVGVDDFSSGHPKNVPPDIAFVRGDLVDPKTYTRLPARCDLILHLAGQSSGEISFDDPVADLAKNTVSTINLIKYGINAGAQRIVYASSMSVYGARDDCPTSESSRCQPLSCYGVGKLAAEGYLRVFQNYLPWVALRMFNIYGPGQDMGNLRQGMVSIYLAQALNSKRVHVKGSLKRFRDFVYIDDVTRAWFLAALSPKTANQAINLGTGRRTTVEELLQELAHWVPGITWFVDGSTPGDQSGIYADPTRIGELLGLKAFVPLEEGLPRFVQWAREAGSIGSRI